MLWGSKTVPSKRATAPLGGKKRQILGYELKSTSSNCLGGQSLYWQMHCNACLVTVSRLTTKGHLF